MTPLDLLVIYGSVRRDRQGIKAARFILETCRGRGHQATLVDPAEERLPLLDRMYKEYEPGQAPEALERLAARIKAADAFIIVSGEYNHSIPPALSNLLDHFLEEYFWRPSAIVCYSAGGFGGVRGRDAAAGDALRAGHAEHPVAPPRPQGPGRLRRRGPPARRSLPTPGRPLPRRAGVVRQRPEGRPSVGGAVLSRQALAVIVYRTGQLTAVTHGSRCRLAGSGQQQVNWGRVLNGSRFSTTSVSHLFWLAERSSQSSEERASGRANPGSTSPPSSVCRSSSREE